MGTTILVTMATCMIIVRIDEKHESLKQVLSSYCGCLKRNDAVKFAYIRSAAKAVVAATLQGEKVFF